MNKITRQQALELISQAKSKSQFYSVVYIKSDKSLRSATCHPFCTKHLKGGQATYNANNSDNIGYYDLDKKGYRCFNINRVTEITVNKQHYIVEV